MSTLARRLGLAVLVIYIAGAAYAGDPINPHGRPMNTGAGKIEHYALWQDEDGWHIRTMTKEYEHHFRGAIEVRGENSRR